MKKLLLLLIIIINFSLLNSCIRRTESLPDISLFSEEYKPDGVSVITDMSLNGTELFISDGLQIISYDISSGEEKFLFSHEIELNMISADGQYIYAYSYDKNFLKIWTKQGELVHEMNFTDEILSSNTPNNMVVTDNYIAISGHKYILRIDKISYDYNIINFDTLLNIENIIYCYDNVVGLNFQGNENRDNYIQKYNLSEEMEIDRVYTYIYNYGISYNQKDSLFYVVESNILLNMEYIKKVEVSDADISLNKVAQINSETGVTIKNLNVFNNVIIWSDLNEEIPAIHMQYINDNTDTLVIYMEPNSGNETLEYLCNTFSAKYGVNVQIKEYNTSERLKVKLMANDNDFDLYCPHYYAIYEYVRASMYENLFKYPKINNAVEENTDLLTLLAVNKGEMFGVPFDVKTRDQEQQQNSPSWKSDAGRQRKEKNVKTYLFSTLNLIEGTYTDESGEELKRMLEFALSNKNNDTAGTYIEEADYMICYYMLINPFSKNKDIAALFLAEYIDLLSGKTAMENISDRYTPEEVEKILNIYNCEDVNYDKIYPSYIAITSDPYLIIGDAYSSVTSGNISVESAVKEAVSKLKTIVYE